MPAQRDDDETCSRCTERTPESDKAFWIQCEQCTTWFHWLCVAPNPLDSLDMIDKWYCESCIAAFADTRTPFTTTYKPAPRKSGRALQKLDYANLDAHLPADANKWLRVLATRKVTEDAFREMRADELTDEWLMGDEGLVEPFWVRRPEGLGMKMPRSDISIEEIARIVGPDKPIDVIDVASQSGLSNWTLGQWATYYSDPRRDKVRNVISLEVSDTPLSAQVQAPALVRRFDWVENFWPPEKRKPTMYPTVQKYCLMSVAQCWTDWHVDFAGSSVYYHILRGEKVFYFIRPTPANIQAYETWSGNTERQENTWLGDHVDEVFKIELAVGNTMIIPAGWIHAVYTPCDTLVIGGNFLTSLDIATQLEIYQVELNTKVPKKFRFPYFVRLLWYTALHYSSLLRPLPPSSPLPASVNPRILRGLKRLSDFLIDQTNRFAKTSQASPERKRIARENVPWDKVKDPVATARELRLCVLRGLGEELDALCFVPPPPLEEGRRAHGHGKHVSPGPKNAKRKSEVLEASTRASEGPVQQQQLGPPAKSVKRDEGEIISKITPVWTSTDSSKWCVDPLDEVSGVRLSEVRETHSSNEVVRRNIDEDGSVTIETRRVVTTITKVRIPPPPPTTTRAASSSSVEDVKPFPSVLLRIPARSPSTPPVPTTSTVLAPTSSASSVDSTPYPLPPLSSSGPVAGSYVDPDADLLGAMTASLPSEDTPTLVPPPSSSVNLSLPAEPRPVSFPTPPPSQSMMQVDEV